MSTMNSEPYDWARDDEAGVDTRLGGQTRPLRAARQVDEDVFTDGPEPVPAPRSRSRQVPVDVSRPGAGQVSYDPAEFAAESRTTRAAGAAGAFVGGAVGAAGGAFAPPVNFVYAPGGNGGGRGGGNGGGRGAAAGGTGGTGSTGSFHQGDRLIYAVEKIEIRSDRDIIQFARAVNRLGRELHLILGMRAEEINGVLSTYKGKWYHFGASSRVKARLVSAHLKVSAEAAKAIGVGALKMAASFDRHFVKPEQEARQASGKKTAPKKTFTIGDV
ncbi:hypothetical protein [Streptomyces sp. NPDC088557]|uniref:hypothetical protein n=1 Tax=Streptomyces sp. NPDC088557 TaxID=3365867 RepID=UPI00381F39DE